MWYNFYILKVNESDKISMVDKVFMMDFINLNIVKMEYVVRGFIVVRVIELEKELVNGVNKSFILVMKVNIGDCYVIG